MNFVKGGFCIYWDDCVIFFVLDACSCCFTFIFIYWTIPASLEWNQLDHDVWSSYCAIELGLKVFDLVYIHGKDCFIILFLLLFCPCPVVEWVQYWLHIMSMVVFLLFLLPRKILRVLMIILLKDLIVFISESIRFWAFLFRRNITASISLLGIHQLKWFISSWFNFGSSNTSRSLCVSYRYSSMFDYMFSMSLPLILWIPLVFVAISPFFHL
jgi:hypothetical protein